MAPPLRNLAIAGYRSFGKEPQYFDKFGKVTLLIGRNNAGKSNVLRFLTEIYPEMMPGAKSGKRSPLDNHLPDQTPLLVGLGEAMQANHSGHLSLREDHPLITGVSDLHQRAVASSVLSKLFAAKRELDGTDLVWSLVALSDRTNYSESWSKAIRLLSHQEVQSLWRALTMQGGGDREHHWEPEVLKRLAPVFPSIRAVIIPAVRQIGNKDSISNGFDGAGIIEKLARLQNPDAHSQSDRAKFQAITEFLRSVMDNPSASIEVPYERDTILVHMDGKTLPLSSLGSGVHEVIILAAAATVLSDNVICIEEPEIHLNPILQRKLVRYLSDVTGNQYVISTHSAALMDTPAAEIYHVRLENGCSIIERVTSDRKKSAVCEDLGYHPSDLLQANCVLWVEGPSDRVYLNYWLSCSSDFIEGVHYSVMFYGGRLAAHLSNNDYDDRSVLEFISLRRLNRRGVIIIDSDKKNKQARVNETKRRLEREFDRGPGHAWITAGREIENYLREDQIRHALAAVYPSAKPVSAFGRYDRFLELKTKSGGTIQAPKVDVARHIAAKFTPDLAVLDLRQRMARLVAFIAESNPNAPAR